ncbi:MAG: hypothetical protein LBB53_00100, partial [Prevotellaceae bacterium]|nr:hypothetical protein [Prevotellaceae bacterium]
RRQYNGRYSNWANLNDSTTFVSPRYSTQASGQATGDAVGKFIYGNSNWTSTNYTSGWGIHTGTTDPCKLCHASGRIPSGSDSSSDWVKLTHGTTSNSQGWIAGTANSVTTNSNAVLYRYPWGSRYGTTSYGSMTIVSKTLSADGKNYVAIMPASGYRNLSDGALYSAGAGGGYWNSTNNNINSAYSMTFTSSGVNAGNISTIKAYGFSVRCVAEF